MPIDLLRDVQRQVGVGLAIQKLACLDRNECFLPSRQSKAARDLSLGKGQSIVAQVNVYVRGGRF